MKYCKNCGSQMSDDSIFCPSCGEKSEGSTQVVSEEVTIVGSSDIKERNLVLSIILSFITCGIYSLYWQVKINDETLTLANEKGPSGVVVILLTILTCGIYGYFWAYKMGACIDKMKGVSNGNTGILYVVIALLGLNIVNMALIQDSINNKVGK